MTLAAIRAINAKIQALLIPKIAESTESAAHVPLETTVIISRLLTQRCAAPRQLLSFSHRSRVRALPPPPKVQSYNPPGLINAAHERLSPRAHVINVPRSTYLPFPSAARAARIRHFPCF